MREKIIIVGKDGKPLTKEQIGDLFMVGAFDAKDFEEFLIAARCHKFKVEDSKRNQEEFEKQRKKRW